MLTGTITALVTPMDMEGKLDLSSFDQLLQYQMNNGVDGIVVAGSTGESLSLSYDEKITLLNHAISKTNKQLKIIAAISEASTQNALNFIEKLNQIPGIDYVLASTPHFVRPHPSGIYQHFNQIAIHSNKPIILYNVPSRTSCDLPDEITLKLAKIDNIVGLKDATGDIDRLIYLRQHVAHDFSLLSGDDSTAIPFILNGGNGVISVASNIIPLRFNKIIKAALDVSHSQGIDSSSSSSILENLKINPSFNTELSEFLSLLFIETNPITPKWMLYNRGLIKTPDLRLPLTTLSIENQIKISSFFDLHAWHLNYNQTSTTLT